MFFLALHLNLKNLLPQDFGARGIFKRVTRVSTGKNIQSYVFQSTSQLLAGWDWQNIWIYSWSLRLLMLPVSDSQKGVMVWNGLGGSRQFFVGKTTTCMRQNQSIQSCTYVVLSLEGTYTHFLAFLWESWTLSLEKLESFTDNIPEIHWQNVSWSDFFQRRNLSIFSFARDPNKINGTIHC